MQFAMWMEVEGNDLSLVSLKGTDTKYLLS